MAVYRRMFVVEDVAKVHRLFLECIDVAVRQDKAARAAGLPTQAALIRDLQRAYADFKRGLDTVAIRGAVASRSRIVELMRKTQKRGDTGIGPHMVDRVVSRPLAPLAGFPTGAVGVADEDVLDRSDGWYWRVQEFGTGTSEVKSIIGNVLRGYFYDKGYVNPSPPDPSLFRHHPLFAPGPPSYAAAKGLRYGIGFVHQEIQGRHFIRDGAAIAEATWRAELRALESATLGELSAAMVNATARLAARRP